MRLDGDAPAHWNESAELSTEVLCQTSFESKMFLCASTDCFGGVFFLHTANYGSEHEDYEYNMSY